VGLLFCSALSDERTGLYFAVKLLLVLVRAVTLGSSPAELAAIFFCLIWNSSNLEGQVPVFISLRNRVAQLYPPGTGSLFIASYDSQGYGGGILTRLHTCHTWVHLNGHLINPSHQSVCLYVYPYRRYAVTTATNTQAIREEMLDASFSMRPVLLWRKVGDKLFPEFLIYLINLINAVILQSWAPNSAHVWHLGLSRVRVRMSHRPLNKEPILTDRLKSIFTFRRYKFIFIRLSHKTVIKMRQIAQEFKAQIFILERSSYWPEWQKKIGIRSRDVPFP
jgi:hypothetical protein